MKNINTINSLFGSSNKNPAENEWYLYDELFNLIKKRSTDYSDSFIYELLQLANISTDKMEVLKKYAVLLDLLNLVSELKQMKIYYQINPDPRNKDNKSLYAKAVIPKFGKHLKSKMIGIHFGSVTKFPEGWTKARKETAKKELIGKAFKILIE